MMIPCWGATNLGRRNFISNSWCPKNLAMWHEAVLRATRGPCLLTQAWTMEKDGLIHHIRHCQRNNSPALFLDGNSCDKNQPAGFVEPNLVMKGRHWSTWDDLFSYIFNRWSQDLNMLLDFCEAFSVGIYMIFSGFPSFHLQKDLILDWSSITPE